MTTPSSEAAHPMIAPLRRYWYLAILALSGFVTSFGAHIVATNLPAYAETVGVGAFVIGLLIGIYDFAELFAKPVAGFIADRRGMKLTLLVGLAIFILGSLLFLIALARSRTLMALQTS
jgi:MFS family permease